jgi:hypothetical protein
MYLQKRINIKTKRKKYFLLASWRSLTKRAGSSSGSVSHKYVSEDPDPHPDPYQNVMDPEHCSQILFPRSDSSMTLPAERAHKFCSRGPIHWWHFQEIELTSFAPEVLFIDDTSKRESSQVLLQRSYSLMTLPRDRAHKFCSRGPFHLWHFQERERAHKFCSRGPIHWWHFQEIELTSFAPEVLFSYSLMTLPRES